MEHRYFHHYFISISIIIYGILLQNLITVNGVGNNIKIVENFNDLNQNRIFSNQFQSILNENNVDIDNDDNDNNENDGGKLYTYDEIVNELEKVTEEFYNELIHIRNMLPSSPPPLSNSIINNDNNDNDEDKNNDYDDDDDDDETLVQQARRRRSIDENVDYFVPDFIRNGIQLISEILPIDDQQLQKQRQIKYLKNICAQKGFIIDFTIVNFNNEQSVICLIKDSLNNNNNNNTLKMNLSNEKKYKLYFGSIDIENFNENVNERKLFNNEYTLIDIERPKKILTFVDKKHNHVHNDGHHHSQMVMKNEEHLIVMIINEKYHLNEPNIIWLQIDSNQKIIYHKSLMNINQISTKNVAIWPKHNILIVHDKFEAKLKLFKFVGTYFDQIEFHMPIASDLNAIETFTLNGVSYLILGYNNYDNPIKKDVNVFRYNYYMERLELIQSIQCNDNILDLKYFSIGHGIMQENFLAIIEAKHIVFYKFLKSKHEFIIFQRLQSNPIRQTLVYGDHDRSFIMVIILQSNDIYFLTYNSLRFIYSPINIRVYVDPNQPIYLKNIKVKNDENQLLADNNVYLMIGSLNDIRIYQIRFYHDNNLFKLWNNHLKWCHDKREELNSLEKHSLKIEKRFHESYFKHEPLKIHGTLRVPIHYGTVVETKEYQNFNHQKFNNEYFKELKHIRQRLMNIEKDIQKDHELLTTNAISINTLQPQIITGNFSFQTLSILKYDGNQINHYHRSSYANELYNQYYHNYNTNEYPLTVNIITDYLNGDMIRNLYYESIRIRLSDYENQNNLQIRLYQPMTFEMIESTEQNVQINSLINNYYNLSNLVTNYRNHQITGMKTFYRPLIVDNSIIANYVNGEYFNSQTILLTNGKQIINNPIIIQSKRLHTRQLNVINVNQIKFNEFLNSVVRVDKRKQSNITLSMPIAFTSQLIVNDIIIDYNNRLNGYNLDDVYSQALWLRNDNVHNQTITGNCYFENNVTIYSDLMVNRINNRNVPEDFIRINHNDNDYERIYGEKIFSNEIYVQNLNISKTLNGFPLINDMPDIIIADDNIEQNITGRKILQNLSIHGSNNINGLLNDMNLIELEQRSRRNSLESSTLLYYDTLKIENVAHFQNGLWFDQINSITKEQFEKMLLYSIKLDQQQWSTFGVEHVHFDQLHVKHLYCDTINGLNLAEDLLTRTTEQTINMAYYSFNNIEITDNIFINRLNNYSFTYLLNNVMKNDIDNQFINDTKEINGDIYVKSLFLDSYINDNIPITDIVFNDDDQQSDRWITGVKQFNGENFNFSRIIVDNLIVDNINNININELINHSLRYNDYQIMSNEFNFKSLIISTNENFESPSINGVSLKWLEEDVILSKTSTKQWQNITGSKYFIAETIFDQIEYDNLFDDITVYEMKHGWIVNNRPEQLIRANFSIDHLKVHHNIYLQNGKLNQIDLNSFFNEIVYLDEKTSISSEIEFFGNVKILGNILLNGRLNNIDTRKDIVINYNNYTGAQRIKGNIRFINSNITVIRDLNVKGQINNIDIDYFCGQVYKPPQSSINGEKIMQNPLIINANVDFWSPIEFQIINHLSFDNLNNDALKNMPNNSHYQKITAKKVIDTLILNGPIIINGYINNVNINYIYDNYMSLTREQIIDAELVLHNVRFNNNIEIERLKSDTNIINGVDIDYLDKNALHLYNDQTFNGNIYFDCDIIIDQNLNTKYINDVLFDHFMTKKRQTSTFMNEIIFTQDLNVNHKMTIVKGKKLSNINIDHFLKDSVLSLSDKNYTIYGEKIFDNINVYLLYTPSIKSNTNDKNLIRISRENLLLKSYDQYITGKTIINTNVNINQTLLIEKINNIDINKLKHNLVRKNSQIDNIIHTKIYVKDLYVNNINVRSFIDNVDLKILNQFTDISNYLRQFNVNLRQIRKRFDLVHENFQIIGSKLLYFDHLSTINLKNLSKNYQSSSRITILPLTTILIDSLLCLFIDSGIDGTKSCNQIEIYCNEKYNKNQGEAIQWKYYYTIYYPGQLLSFEQIDNNWLLSSLININSDRNNGLQTCLQLNNISLAENIIYQNSSLSSSSSSMIWLQSVRFFSSIRAFQQNFHPKLLPIIIKSHQKYDHYKINEQMIMVTDQNPSFILFANDNVLNIIKIGNLNQLIFNKINVQYQMDGQIEMMYQQKNLLLVSYLNLNHLDIFAVQNDLNILKLHTIPNVKPEFMLIMQNYQISDYKNFIILNNLKFLFIYATIDGVQYSKVQEIHVGIIKHLALYSNSNTERDSSDLFMIQNYCNQLEFYRQYGLSGFRSVLKIPLSENVLNVGFSLRPNWFLYIVYYSSANIYDENQSLNLEILKPIYRNNI